MSHNRYYRPILSSINLAVELGSNFAEKIVRLSSALESGLGRIKASVGPAAVPNAGPLQTYNQLTG